MTDSGEIGVVTGASGGIGADLARAFGRRGLRLALVARNESRLQALAREIAGAGAPAPLVVGLDLALPEAPQALQDRLAAEGRSVSLLVNNAGFGLAGRAESLSRVQQLEMIDLNVRSLVDLTLRFAPDLIRTRGRLMNVASVAAFFPGPGMAVYYATKAFVLSFTEAVAEEMKEQGVTVTALCPGMTPTGFQERAGLSEGAVKLAPSTSSQAVAEAGAAALFAGRRRSVPGLANRAATALAPLLPRALLLPALMRAQAGRARS